MVSEKQLRQAAEDLNILFGLEPPINPKEEINSLAELLKVAIKYRKDDDVFSKETGAVIVELLKYKTGEPMPVSDVAEKPTTDSLWQQVEDAQKLSDLKDIAVANIEFKPIRGTISSAKNAQALRDAMYEILVQLQMGPKKEDAEIVLIKPSAEPQEKIKEPVAKAIPVQKTPPVLIVNPLFQHACPMLTDDEFYKLEALILKDEKILNPILIWKNQIVDGHNRYEISQRYGIPFETQEKEFKNEEDVILWIKENAVSQRNLPEFARFEMIAEIEALLKVKGKEKKAHGATAPGKTAEATDAPKHDTRAELAKKAGMSPTQIAKAKVIEENAPEDVKEELRKGKTTIGKEFDKIKGKKKVIVHNLDEVSAAVEDLRKWSKKYAKNDMLKDSSYEINVIADKIAQILPVEA